MIFVALFATSFIAHIIHGDMNRSWTFMIAFGIGTATEVLGTSNGTNVLVYSLCVSRICWSYPNEEQSLEFSRVRYRDSLEYHTQSLTLSEALVYSLFALQLLPHSLQADYT